MQAEPRIVELPEQPYVAIRGLVTMQTVGAIADRLPEVFGWLAARGVEPTGAPFFKYNVIDMENQLEVEVGVPVAANAAGDGNVLASVLPQEDTRPSPMSVTPISSSKLPRRCWPGRRRDASNGI